MQLVCAPGASVVTGQVKVGAGPAGAVRVSVTRTPVTVWLPVLRTTTV